MRFQHHLFKIGGDLQGFRVASGGKAPFKEWEINAGEKGKVVYDIRCKLEEASSTPLLAAAVVVAESIAENDQLELLCALRQTFPSM
eukprot:scaffold1110_cov18-Tisochrysis_lutea.AAC.2